MKAAPAAVPAAAGALLAAALFWIGLRLFERAMIFAPSRAMTAHPGTVGLAWEPLRLTASDGVRLRAWWIPASADGAPALLCLHGNAGNLSGRTDKMRIFHDAGAAQLWIEWRGYGESGGSPDEPGLCRDAAAGLAWLKARGVPPERLVVYGESLGAGPAVELASRGGVGALVVDSGFSSVADMARLVLPWFPLRLARTRFDNASKLPRIAIPTLFLHSREDEIVPFAQAEKNYAVSAGKPKRLVELRGGHNEGFLDSMPRYRDALAELLAGLPPPPPKP